MSDVLGFIVKSVQRNYTSICSQHNFPIKAKWPRSHISSFQRHPWTEFSIFLEDVTDHLEENGIGVLAFQKSLSPSLFAKFMVSRMGKVVFTPEKLLKAIDTWGGPFMFHVCTSSLQVTPNHSILEITLKETYRPSRRFFEHCSAGTRASLELMDFNFEQLSIQSIDDVGVKIQITHQNESRPVIRSEIEHLRITKSQVKDLVFLLESGKIGEEFTLDSFLEVVLGIAASLKSLYPEMSEATNILTIISSHVQFAFDTSDREKQIVHLETGLIEAKKLLALL